MAFLPSSQDCSKSAMNSNLRKKFTSPFSVKKYPYSRATAAKLSPTNSKWKALVSDSETAGPKHNALTNSEFITRITSSKSRLQHKQSMMESHGRMQENDDMESKQVSDSMMSRKILQQNLTKSSFGAKSTSVKENSYPQKQNCQVNSIFLREKWLDDKEMHLCGHITHPQLDQSQMPSHIPCIMSEAEAQKGENSRGLNNKEGPIQIVRLAVPAPAPLACKRNTIRDPSNLVCSRDRSYQEQSEEFQQILSSKVRQIAEVAECLQHNELLYKILQI